MPDEGVRRKGQRMDIGQIGTDPLIEANMKIMDLQKRLAALQPTWTGERPTQEGYYWWQGPGFGPEVVCVYHPDGPDTDRLELVGFEEGSFAIMDGEWAGPLTPPTGQWSSQPIGEPR